MIGTMMKFSVLMSVYNKEKPEYLDACLESIFSQTLLPDEIVLVEDGPLNDGLYKIIKNWKEKSKIIKSVVLLENSGLPIALNKGLKLCKYNYVARMDSDDICVPDRFEKQLRVFQNDPSIAVLGGHVAEYDEDLKILLGFRKVPQTYDRILTFVKRRSPFNHPTVVFKKDVILSVGGYPEHLRNWQDYAHWCKILGKGYKTGNLDDVLVKMRTGNELFNRRSGLNYLKYELEAYQYVLNNGLINRFEYSLVIISKIMIRMLPKKILRLIYKIFLRKN